MDTNNALHERWLWFTDLAGQPAEVESCGDVACEECAAAAPIRIAETIRAA